MKSFFKRLFTLNDTPERIAFAFALGIFLSFSPLIGLHAFLGFLAAILFGLNRIALIAGLVINNPWTLVPIYAAGTYLGGLFVGFPTVTNLPSLELRALWSGDFWLQLAGQWSIIKAMVLGSFILSISMSLSSYVIILRLLRQKRAHKLNN